MTNRQYGIIYQLATSETPLTAKEIAERLAVSPRTIKMEMQSLSGDIRKIGAELISKRGKGYTIKVKNTAVFEPIFEQLSLRASLANDFIHDEMARSLYIARKLVSSSVYVKIDDIADELYMSKSALRNSIREAIEFLSSYGLKEDNKPHFGIRMVGAEYKIRIAMVELFAIHFHKANLNNAGVEYEKWLKCDKKERYDIRHVFLKTLLSTDLRIRDLSTQRLSIYLIIARNRYKAGYKLVLPEKWAAEIVRYKEYSVSAKIYENLSKKFPDYAMPENEVVFLAILLLCNRDIGNEKTEKQSFPDFYDDACKYSKGMLSYVEKELHIDLNKFDWVNEELKNILITVLAKKHFGLSGTNISLGFEDKIIESPFAIEISKLMIQYLQKKIGCNIVGSEIMLKFTSFVHEILSITQYDIKKIKLLIVDKNGISFGKGLSHELLFNFGPLIESCTYAELYEIRRMDQKKYDGVIMQFSDIYYNYELPCVTTDLILQKCDFIKIYNSILIKAFCVENLVPDDSIIHVYNDFEYISEERFFQLISFKHCHNSENQKLLEQLLIQNEKIMSYHICGKSVVIFGRPDITDGDSIELYHLKKTGAWGKNEVNYILYVCIDFKNDIKKAKAIESSLCELMLHPDFFCQFTVNKAGVFKKLINESLKL